MGIKTSFEWYVCHSSTPKAVSVDLKRALVMKNWRPRSLRLHLCVNLKNKVKQLKVKSGNHENAKSGEMVKYCRLSYYKHHAKRSA